MNIDSKMFTIVGWIGIALIAIATVVVVMHGDWFGVAVLVAFLIASVLFVVIEHRLPALFDALFVTAAIVNAAGWVWTLYHPIWGYDEIAHFFTTFAVTLSLGYLCFYVMRRHFNEHPWHFVIVVTSFGVTLGAWWEVFEWLILKELFDPVGDIVVDTFGALLAAVVAVWALRKESGDEGARGKQTPADYGANADTNRN